MIFSNVEMQQLSASSVFIQPSVNIPTDLRYIQPFNSALDTAYAQPQLLLPTYISTTQLTGNTELPCIHQPTVIPVISSDQNVMVVNSVVTLIPIYQPFGYEHAPVLTPSATPILYAVPVYPVASSIPVFSTQSDTCEPPEQINGIQDGGGLLILEQASDHQHQGSNADASLAHSNESTEYDAESDVVSDLSSEIEDVLSSDDLFANETLDDYDIDLNKKVTHTFANVERILEPSKCEGNTSPDHTITSWNITLVDAAATISLSPEPFRCLTCARVFSNRKLLRRHEIRHGGERRHACHICEKKFYSNHKVIEHIRTHTRETPLSCSQCDKKFRSHSNLSSHRRNRHNSSQHSKNSNSQFLNLLTDNKASASATSKVIRTCKFCFQSFARDCSLTTHVRLYHHSDYIPSTGQASRMDKCPVCCVMMSKTSIKRHIESKHDGIKKFACCICSQRFVSQSNLSIHQWKHRAASSRPFRCSKCVPPVFFIVARQLDHHDRVHHGHRRGKRPFVCNECGKGFTRRANLKRHIATTPGHDELSALRHECDHCGKVFWRADHLANHMRIHSSEKEYSCQLCGKKSASKSNYNAHKATHFKSSLMNVVES